MNINFAPIYEMYGPVYAGPGAMKHPELIKSKRLSAVHKEAVNKAKKYAMEQSIRAVLLKQTRQHEVQQLINVKRTQAMVLLSRIYVGSINYDVKEDTIRQAFSCFGPVKSVSLSYDPITQKHMGYAFLEFEYPEGAQLSLNQTSGITISGRQCKVGRPTNMPHTGPLVDELYNEALQLARIYVSNVHHNISSDDLKLVFEAFGEIESCMLQPDLSRPGKHRGFGFIEYKNIQATLEAIGAMNMFDLGGQMLRVARAITPPNLVMPAGGTMMTAQMPAAAAVAAASITAQMQALEVEQVVKIDSADTGDHDQHKDSVSNTSSGSRRKRNRKKFSDTKASTEDVGAPSLVIPEGNRERSRSKEKSVESKVEVHPQPEKSEEYLEKENGATVSEKIVDNSNSGNEALLEVDNVKIRGREARSQMMQKLMRQTHQRVMLLRNLVGREELDEYVEEEVREECCKFGQVSEVKIFVNDDDEDEESKEPTEREENEDDVRIFVVFESPESLEEAIARMNGRFFGGRVVIATRYEQELYNAGDYTA